MGVIAKIKQSVFPSERDPHRKCKAQGMVEFALILPLLLLLLFGVFEFGRMLFVYSAVYTASREGARYGSAGGDEIRYGDCEGIRAAAMRVGSIAGISSGNIAIRYDSPGIGLPAYSNCPPGPISGGLHRVVVNVATNYQPILPLFPIPNFTIESESARTIISDIDLELAGIVPPTPTLPPPTATPPLPKMHLSAFSGTRSQSGNPWNANILVGIHDENHLSLDGVTVTVRMTTGNHPNQSCITSGGTCAVTFSGLSGGNRTFRIQSVTHPGYVYDPSSNDVNDQITVP